MKRLAALTVTLCVFACSGEDSFPDDSAVDVGAGGLPAEASGGTQASGGSTPDAVGGGRAVGGSGNTGVGGSDEEDGAGGDSSSGGETSSGGSASETGGAEAMETGGSDGEGAGGTDSGGSGTCDESDPPSGVAAWIDESWDAQLGDNIENRQAWLLDNVMMGEGQINICVRWGATTAPSAEVKTQLAPSVEDWFNDWFQALGDYGCFPYGAGIVAKVTGWAVRPGNESWVSDLGPDVAVYTETDGEGEPKCADSCSFFENWDHEFPSCPGGEAFHTDYWIWVDDALPGGGGAAAVGGDWGLRMPVASFLDSLGNAGSNVIEHEMGHGFGFQDYYDWTGSTPAGGSLMIVGSQNGGTPTVGDTWLLRRAWLESKALRGW